MCGIAGFLSRGTPAEPEARAARLERMTSCIAHRGPDDAGSWSHPKLDVNLGFRRLAILDLTPTGHQPMRSPDRRFTLIMNGEIYNFRDLRAELLARGHSFRGHSDTEVALAAFSEWGVEQAVRRFAGMFAMAVWDEATGELALIRDRFGKKPLYYGWQNGTFLFASELKALAGDQAFSSDIDYGALASYLALAYVPSPLSIFAGISKLEPATILRVRMADGAEIKSRYWDFREHVVAGRGSESVGDQAVETEAQTLLDRCVSERMVADVPIGAFLSGGIDSSLVVATMQRLGSSPVKTFAIGFAEQRYDEAVFARQVAAHLGTDHHELYVTPREARDALTRMSTVYDEPFADSSQLPTYLVAALARKSVTVVLTGDGGDEMFGGYTRYIAGARLKSFFDWTPTALRRAIAKTLLFLAPETWDSVLPSNGTLNGDRIHKLAGLIAAPSTLEAYRNLLGHREIAGSLVRTPVDLHGVFASSVHFSNDLPITSNMMLLDALTYLADDILAKVDRATMAVSLEARCPFLDHRLAEWATRLPLEHKIRGGRGKLLLRRLLGRYLPAHLIERPKMGFGVPIAGWLRGPLKPWAEGVLSGLDGAAANLLNRQAVLRLWAEHQSGRRNWQADLWNVLVFLDWLARWRSSVRSLRNQSELVSTRH
jgi:asparagine synthase (glutamine-hydrolysing)